MDYTRPDLKAEQTPTTKEIAWAAGFLEGDGYFGANSYGCELVSVAQVQRWPLERLRLLFGGRIAPRAARSPNANDFWQWDVSTMRARGIMFTVYLLMSPKRKRQIRNALTATKT